MSTTDALERRPADGADAEAGPSATPREKGKEERRAVLYRMVMPDHLCPFGLKAKSLLERQGYAVEDHHLTTRGETDAFKKEHGVEATPQAFIDGERVGGYDDLKRLFGKTVREDQETTYAPIVAIFSTSALTALAIVWNVHGGLPPLTWLKWFIAVSMTVLAIQKLQDVEGFVNGFLGYDLLARRWVPYGYAYPYLEAYAGIGMLALIGSGSPFVWLVAPVGLCIGTIGAVSVVKAVYVDRRELKCACVGGGSNVPLGVISLTENVMMVVLGLWMLGAQTLG